MSEKFYAGLLAFCEEKHQQSLAFTQERLYPRTVDKCASWITGELLRYLWNQDRKILIEIKWG